MRDEEERYHKKWTNEETQTLVRMCKKKYTPTQICEELGRNENAVRAKASREGYILKGGEFCSNSGTVSKNSKVVGTYTIRKKPWWKRLLGGR